MQLHGSSCINAQGHLEIGGVDTVELAHEFGTPLYVLDEDCFRSRCRQYRDAFPRDRGEVIYAGKTLLTRAVVRMVEEEGLSLDVASGGELYTALSVDFPPSRIFFHGNNKTPAEIRMGMEKGVARFMADSLYELSLLENTASQLNTRQAVILRLTPGVEAHTHEYIKTGQIDSKFGLPIETGQAMEAVRRTLESPRLQLKGIHCHIGSQILDLAPYEHALNIMIDFCEQVARETGHHLEELDMGGGLGIFYTSGDKPPSIGQFAGLILNTAKQLAAQKRMPAPKILVEPGRSVSGPAVTTLYSVGAVKDIPGIRTYVAVDGGINDNPRPALYGASYEAVLANRISEQVCGKYAIAGNCCESGDMLIWDCPLPGPRPGDILAVPATGAYNYTMSMNYNRFPRPAMVLVKDGNADVIVRRETYSDLVSHELLPPRWL